MRSLAFITLFILSGCALFKPEDKFESRPIAFAELSGWETGNHDEALASFKNSCPIMEKKPRAASLSGLNVSASSWKKLCAKADAAISGKRFFEENFTPYRISNNGKEQGLFTGYYEPLLYGSLTRHGDYVYPVYGPPPGLARKKPFLTRAQIDQGGLEGKRLEVVWVDDPVMLFFMQIQGSGRIRLENGSEFIAAYADQNGHPYETLGKIMIDEGYLEKGKVNFFTIRQWLYEHKDQAIAMMQRNPSYVFFKRQDKLEVKGAIGAPLTPKRSIAVDSRYIPYGLPLYLETTLPELPGVPERPFRRLLIAQDTGGAIRSPVRGDVFFGHGQEAEYLAGFMKQRGIYALLLPKD